MSLKSLFVVVLLVAVLLVGVAGVANAQESKGNSPQAANVDAPRSGQPSVEEVVETSNQQVHRNGVPQGNALQQGPCGPACRRQQVEVLPVEPPTIPPPESKPVEVKPHTCPTCPTCPENVCPSCPEIPGYKVTVVVTIKYVVTTVIEDTTTTTTTYIYPVQEEEAALPWWLIVLLVASIPAFGAAVYLQNKNA